MKMTSFLLNRVGKKKHNNRKCLPVNIKSNNDNTDFILIVKNFINKK